MSKNSVTTVRTAHEWPCDGLKHRPGHIHSGEGAAAWPNANNVYRAAVPSNTVKNMRSRTSSTPNAVPSPCLHNRFVWYRVARCVVAVVNAILYHKDDRVFATPYLIAHVLLVLQVSNGEHLASKTLVSNKHRGEQQFQYITMTACCTAYLQGSLDGECGACVLGVFLLLTVQVAYALGM